jgi:hypothetical protein
LINATFPADTARGKSILTAIQQAESRVETKGSSCRDDENHLPFSQNIYYKIDSFIRIFAMFVRNIMPLVK